MAVCEGLLCVGEKVVEALSDVGNAGPNCAEGQVGEKSLLTRGGFVKANITRFLG